MPRLPSIRSCPCLFWCPTPSVARLVSEGLEHNGRLRGFCGRRTSPLLLGPFLALSLSRSRVTHRRSWLSGGSVSFASGVIGPGCKACLFHVREELSSCLYVLCSLWTPVHPQEGGVSCVASCAVIQRQRRRETARMALRFSCPVVRHTMQLGAQSCRRYPMETGRFPTEWRSTFLPMRFSIQMCEVRKWLKGSAVAAPRLHPCRRKLSEPSLHSLRHFYDAPPEEVASRLSTSVSTFLRWSVGTVTLCELSVFPLRVLGAFAENEHHRIYQIPSHQFGSRQLPQLHWFHRGGLFHPLQGNVKLSRVCIHRR